MASRFAVCLRQGDSDPHFSVLSPHKDAAMRSEVVSVLKYFVRRFVTRVPCLIVGAQHAAPLLGKIAPTRRLSCVLSYRRVGHRLSDETVLGAASLWGLLYERVRVLTFSF